MPNDIFIQVRFTVDTPKGPFRDSIVYPQAVYNALTDKDIAAHKQQRIDDWVQRMDQAAQADLPIIDKGA